jgi:hypothetical protein
VCGDKKQQHKQQNNTHTDIHIFQGKFAIVLLYFFLGQVTHAGVPDCAGVIVPLCNICLPKAVSDSA